MRRTASEPQPLLDVLASLFPDSSRTTLRQMLQTGRVRVGGEVEKDAKRLIEPGEQVEVGSKMSIKVVPPEISILHEDVDIIVILKAHGLLTVATERERDATAQAYLNTYLGSRGEDRVHVVHRLDRETSGILVFAKNFHAREQLKEQFAAHTADRVYVAIIEGEIHPPEGTISSYLLERSDLLMVSVQSHADAKFAVTHYNTVESNGRYSMLQVTLETGRKNQIRAHLSEQGHPLVGDQMYGSAVNPLKRLGLHAKFLGFDHPTNGRRLTFTAPVPKVFRSVFKTGA